MNDAHSTPDGIEIARGAFNASAKATFDDVHAALSERLLASKATDESFFQRVAEAAATLSAPLSNEKIETTISKDGKRKIEVVEIGNRVTTFKEIIEKEGANLKEYWKQWDEVQNEYLELGVEVFGPEVFGEDALSVKIREKGFKREMELLNLEHNTMVGELDDEIEDTSAKIVQKMKASEKVYNSSSPKVWVDADRVVGDGRCVEERANEIASSTHSRLIFSSVNVGCTSTFSNSTKVI